MNQKIYEYKDALNWFLAEWGDRSDYNEYSEVSSEASELVDLVESLVGDTDLGFPLNVTVVRYASSLQFLTFLFQIVEETITLCLSAKEWSSTCRFFGPGRS